MKDIDKIAQEEMGAKVVGKVPDGGGVSGAAALAGGCSSLKGSDTTVGKHDFFEICVVLREAAEGSEFSPSTRRLFRAHGLRTGRYGWGKSPAEALLHLGMALIGLVYSSETGDKPPAARFAGPDIANAALGADAVRMPDSVTDGVGWILRAQPRTDWAEWAGNNDPNEWTGQLDHLAQHAALVSVTGDVEADRPLVCTADWKWLRG